MIKGGEVIKGGVARKEGGTSGVLRLRGVRESVRRITSYLMLRGDSERGERSRNEIVLRVMNER